VATPTAARVRRVARAATLALAFLGSALPSPAAPAAAPKRVLVLFDEDKELPGLARILRSMREVFEAEMPGGIELHTESMNLSQFRGEAYDRLLAGHYRQKYADRRPDLLVAVMGPSLDFLLRHGESTFPGAPIVFCGADASDLEGKTLPASVTGVLLKRTFAPTLEVALRLQPDTRDVFLVSGASAFDRKLAALALRDLSAFQNRVTITSLAALPMDDLLGRLQGLSPHSVVLYTSIFSDGAGRPFVPHEAVSRIADAANAPVYVFVDQYLGRGAVGGHLYTVDQHGVRAASMALRILHGEAPSTIPVLDAASSRDIFDWRQLARFNLDESRLPPGSEVRFRPASAWVLYRRWILGGAALVLLQSALIVSLLLSRAGRMRALRAVQESEEGRRLAEEAAARQREELAHALRVSTLGELTASFAHEINQPLAAIMTNAQGARRLRAPLRDPSDEFDEVLVDIAQDAKRASETIRRLQTLFRKQHLERTEVDVNALIEDTVALVRGNLASRRILVRLALAEALPRVLADAIQVQQVVLNLVMNACDAMAGNEEGAREIVVETRIPAAAGISITVCDQGQGAAEAELERIFEHFVSTKPQGLGMGLAISRSIVQAHGGRIWASRNPGRGLTLHVEMPVTPLSSRATALPPPVHPAVH
jgi:signal transduction histidine kinase